MANKKISELPSATLPLGDDDLFEVVQGGVNKKVAKSAVGDAHFLGVYTDETALTTAHATAESGDYAYVDAGVGNPVQMWIWDDDDSQWIQSGSVAGRVRTVTGADSSEQLDNQGLIIFNSATPFDFTLDALQDDTIISFVNYGAGAVTFIEGSGVTAPTGNVVLSASIGDSYPSAMVHYVTGTTPRVINAGTNGLALITSDTSGGTITLDFAMEKERLFVGSASFATAKAIALSNDDNALVFSLTVTLTNAAAVLTFPSTFTMPNSDIRWNDSAHTFTITAGTVGKYVFVATWDGTDWNMEATNPFA